jgi:Kef-type K+ transport system membrane component KefB
MPHAPDELLLQLFVIFVWAKVFGEIFEQFSIPAVLGEILAGVVFGPFSFSLIVPSPIVQSIAQVGAIFLLFTVGLETRPAELIKVGRRSLGVALAGVLVPFFLGFTYLMVRGNPAHEATFVATAMVATSVGITARVMGDMHVLHSRAAKIILAAAVFDDILGMVLLALVVGLVSAGQIKWFSLGLLSAEAAAFALIMIFVAPRVVHRMRPGLRRLSTQNAPLIAALAICLGLSVAAERIGMAAIIGAFFAGLAFAEYAPEWGLLPRVSGITEFLAPYFFFVMGAKVNLRIFDRHVIWEAVIISVLAIIAKVVGCGLPTLREGWRTALKVGIGMTPRGEVGLIVALVGLNMKLISEVSYAVVVAMTGATTLFAPPLLRKLFDEDRPTPPRGAGMQQAVTTH